MKIKYVGVKEDGETAFASLSGIERWMPGDSFDVKDTVAARMLQHPDVFMRDEDVKPSAAHLPLTGASLGSESTSDAQPGLAALTLAPGGVVAVPSIVAITPPNGTPIKLSGMSVTELKALAKTLDVKVHPNAGAQKFIDALVAAFPSEPAESKQ